jgi:hypothetical protein
VNLIVALLAMATLSGGVALAESKVPTKEQLAEGWISLFDGETLFGWNQLGDAQWRVDGGNLVCDSGSGGWLASSSQFADFELAVTLRVSPKHATGVAVRATLEGHPGENGAYIVPVSEPEGPEPKWHEVRLTATGDNVSGSVDGSVVRDLKGRRVHGVIGLYFFGHGSRVEISDVKLRPLSLEPIFNGKDLTDWNIVPDHPSVFSVVDGALNIKNGNGQIETAGVYKDFVLQLEIISNGDKLNSGVFFRGPVGVFWKGYESQVRNEWENDDRTHPHDFGTGGNYGNQPARRVVPNDREWFYKTIVCDGNHAAVWVNGFQVSDFTDMRPVAENGDGKHGYVPGPGTIHLQGHDPKTDLSFRNIRIHEYPRRVARQRGQAEPAPATGERRPRTRPAQ